MHSPQTIKAACEDLAKRDTALARAYDHIGIPDWRTTEPCFESIARTVTYQLLSTRAAGTIWGRVKLWAGGDVNPERILEGNEDELRACGLSRPKISHLKSIAGAIRSNALPIARLHTMKDAEARKALIAVKGIGPWTAEIFLMSSLGRMDAFPEGDVGLMEAHRMLTDSEERLKPREFQTLAESWRPWRGVAAHLLWGHINKTREAAY